MPFHLQVLLPHLQFQPTYLAGNYYLMVPAVIEDYLKQCGWRVMKEKVYSDFFHQAFFKDNHTVSFFQGHGFEKQNIYALQTIAAVQNYPILLLAEYFSK